MQNMNHFDQLMRVDERGVEFWSARELMQPLGYVSWSDFAAVIERAKSACAGSGIAVTEHFQPQAEPRTRSGRGGPNSHLRLTRYGAYLTAMNGDPRKEQVALAQTYFAEKTREREVDEDKEILRQRVNERLNYTKSRNALTDAAQDRGVTNFGGLTNAGYQGLYGGLGSRDIKKRKGIPDGHTHLDHAGILELSANSLNNAITEQKLKKEDVSGEPIVFEIHRGVGGSIRRTIHENIGIHLEDLPSLPSVKELERQQQQARLREQRLTALANETFGTVTQEDGGEPLANGLWSLDL